MPHDKVVPIREAVARFVPDGAAVRMGTALLDSNPTSPLRTSQLRSLNP